MEFPAPEVLGSWPDGEILRVLVSALALVGSGSNTDSTRPGASNGFSSANAGGLSGIPGSSFVSARQLADSDTSSASGKSSSKDAQGFLFNCQAQQWMWRVAMGGLEQYLQAQPGQRTPEGEQLAFYLAGALAYRMRSHTNDLMIVDDEGDEKLSEQGVNLVRTVADMAIRGWSGAKVIARKLILGLVVLLHLPMLPSQPPPLQLVLALFLSSGVPLQVLPPFESLPPERQSLILDVLRLTGEHVQSDLVPARKRPVPEQLSQAVSLISSALNSSQHRNDALEALSAFLGSRSIVLDDDDTGRGLLPNADLAALLPQLLSQMATELDSDIEFRTSELIGQVLARMRGDAGFGLVLSLLPPLLPELTKSLADPSEFPHAMDVFFGVISRYPQRAVRAFAEGQPGEGEAVRWILETSCGLLGRAVEEGVSEEDAEDDPSTLPLSMFIDLFEHISTLPEADPALAAFVPVAQSVVAAILQRGMCPASWRKWMSSAKNHHLQGVRLNLTEILTAFPPAFLSSIALPAALNSMRTGYNILSQGDENGWRPLEAGSWLLGDMADYLPVSAVECEAAREATAMLAPVVNSMVETFRTTNKLSQEPYRVLHSAVSMYSGLADREGLLSSEDTTSWIGTIFAVLAIPALAGKTAANLKVICKSTVSKGLVPVLPEMVAAVQGAGLAGLDLELAVEGIAAVVAKAPKDTALPVIRSVLELLLQRVANGLQTREQGLESLKEAMAQLSGFLRGLGTAVDGSLEDVVDLTGDKEVVVFESSKKYVRAGETINTAHDEELARALRDPDSTMLVGGTWQMVEKIGEMLSGWRKIGRAEEEIVEAYCTLLLVLLRRPSAALPLALSHRVKLSNIVADLLSVFPDTNHVYQLAAGWINHRPSAVFLPPSETQNTVQVLSAATSSANRVLGAKDGIRYHPDVTHEFFSLLSRTLGDPTSQMAFAGMPGELLDSLFLQVVPLAMASDDKMATRSISSFLSDFIRRGRTDSATDSEVALGAFVDAVVGRLGEGLIKELMALISFQAPRTLVQQLSELLQTFWTKFPTESRAVITAWLEGYSNDRVSDTDKRIVLKKLANSTRSSKRFKDAIKEWSAKCRGVDVAEWNGGKAF